MLKIPEGFCQLNIYRVLFDSCLSPSLDYKFHGGRECVSCLCLLLSSRVWYVEDSQYASAEWTHSSMKSSLISSGTVSLLSSCFSSLSFLSYFVYSGIFIHIEKCTKYVYSLTNNFKANTHLTPTQVEI